MRPRFQLATIAAAAVLMAGCGGGGSGDQPTVTMSHAAAVEAGRAQALAESLEGQGYLTRGNRAYQAMQNGYETLRRERCRRRHPHARCHVRHLELRP